MNEARWTFEFVAHVRCVICGALSEGERIAVYRACGIPHPNLPVGWTYSDIGATCPRHVIIIKVETETSEVREFRLTPEPVLESPHEDPRRDVPAASTPAR